MRRQDLLDMVAARIIALPSDRILRVAIDGVDGAGKTVFADELAAAIQVTHAGSNREIIRASVDGFHNPREIRYRRGRTSPRGFFEDSYDYERLVRLLLEPLGPSGDGRYRRAAFDHRSDLPVEVSEEHASPGAILLFDGIFLHRPELRRWWDYSIFLDVPFHVSIPRCAARGDGSPDPDAESNRRYVEGQRIYIAECSPGEAAGVVIDNEHLDAPRIVDLAAR